jgi:hypothetical protein
MLRVLHYMSLTGISMASGEATSNLCIIRLRGFHVCRKRPPASMLYAIEFNLGAAAGISGESNTRYFLIAIHTPTLTERYKVMESCRKKSACGPITPHV